MAGHTSNTVALFAAGTFAYHCQIHPRMKGTIRVPVTTNITSGFRRGPPSQITRRHRGPTRSSRSTCSGGSGPEAG